MTGLRFTVHGQPKPKGSLRHVGGGVLREQVELSGAWRKTVAGAAWVAAHNARIAGAFPPWPLDGPVAVEVTVTLVPTAAAAKRGDRWPDGNDHGDVDKHGRNVLDALQDAGVVTNDARVVELTVRKVYPGRHPDALTTAGAVVTVRALHTPSEETRNGHKRTRPGQPAARAGTGGGRRSRGGDRTPAAGTVGSLQFDLRGEAGS